MQDALNPWGCRSYEVAYQSQKGFARDLPVCIEMGMAYSVGARELDDEFSPQPIKNIIFGLNFSPMLEIPDSAFYSAMSNNLISPYDPVKLLVSVTFP